MLTLQSRLILIARVALGYLVSGVLAVWLFMQAKRSGRAKWIWALFALTFGLEAVLLYFVLEMLNELKQQRGSESARRD
jgi:hypothetical protein